jgi:hypothetical protein
VFVIYVLYAVVFLKYPCKSHHSQAELCILHKARLFINYTVLTESLKKYYGSSLFNSSYELFLFFVHSASSCKVACLCQFQSTG